MADEGLEWVLALARLPEKDRIAAREFIERLSLSQGPVDAELPAQVKRKPEVPAFRPLIDASLFEGDYAGAVYGVEVNGEGNPRNRLIVAALFPALRGIT